MFSKTGASLILFTAAIGLSGCSTGRPQRATLEQARRPPPPMLFVSPAGKPYRDGSPDNPPMEQWFVGTDTNGDGALDPDEFRADFAAAFAEFDLDDNGNISGTEIMHYERETFPEISSAGSRGGGRQGGRSGSSRGGREGRPEGGRGGRGRGQGGGRQSERATSHGGDTAGPVGGAARFGLLPIHHPIAQADTNINRRITQSEWETAANLRFRLLDTDGDGQLLREQLEELLPQRPPRRR